MCDRGGLPPIVLLSRNQSLDSMTKVTACCDSGQVLLVNKRGIRENACSTGLQEMGGLINIAEADYSFCHN